MMRACSPVSLPPCLPACLLLPPCLPTCLLGRLASVPLLLEGLLPEPSRLADLVVALAKDVDWDSPRERALALARVRGTAAGG